MMKKFMTTLIFLSVATPTAFCHRGSGGAAVAGTLGGLMVGTMIGSAAGESSARKARVDDKIERVQREQDQDKVAQLQREMDKKEVETRLEQQRLFTMQQERERSNSLLYILFGIIIFMFLAVIGLGFLLINMRKKS